LGFFGAMNKHRVTLTDRELALIDVALENLVIDTSNKICPAMKSQDQVAYDELVVNLVEAMKLKKKLESV